MIDARIRITTATAAREVSLASYLDADAEEAAHQAEYAWIKSLRGIEIDGAPFRDRFTVRGDSLWWFSEIYLHKQQAILNIHRTLAAVHALLERERPVELTVKAAAPDIWHVVALAAAARGVRGQHVDPGVWRSRLRTLQTRARRLTWSAYLSPQRLHRPPPASGPATVAAFIHRAFWKRGGEDGSAESYIGPVLGQLEAQLGAEAVHYVGIGPTENFRARRAWRSTSPGSKVVPIERYAGLRQLNESKALWRHRDTHLRTLAASRALRDAAVIRGADCWPIVYEQLAGITGLQWPWSVRAMDEAAAALDAIGPDTVVTYAEAGGWGRALVLEARRRGISSAGLQHGFIYRHWLNYRHEPDEMQESSTPAFPAPTRTLLFDDFAAQHLRTRGNFPDAALAVTGSPRLDELARTLATLPPDAVAHARRALGMRDQDALVLLVTKEREARAWLPDLYAAASGISHATLVIKPHPAETEEAYASATAHANVRIVSPTAPLAPLLASARAVVTVNSTVALDAAALDIPGLTIGLPNNLSPFVEAGVLAGGDTTAVLPGLLNRILYDEGFRQQLSDRRRVVLGRHAMAGDGRAAARCAEIVRELARQGKGR
jgi:hypothetical protein